MRFRLVLFALSLAAATACSLVNQPDDPLAPSAASAGVGGGGGNTSNSGGTAAGGMAAGGMGAGGSDGGAAASCDGATEGAAVKSGPSLSSAVGHHVTMPPTGAFSNMGDYLITWTKDGVSPFAAFAQRFDANGNKKGNAVAVSGGSHFVTSASAAAMDDGGDAVVAYTDNGQLFGVFFQRFDAANTKLGGVVQASPANHSVTNAPAVAMDASGNFVVVWNKAGTSPFGIYARRYNSAGVAMGKYFPVSADSGSTDVQPAAAMAADGRFIIAWTDTGDHTVLARRFTAAGAPVGSIFLVSGASHSVSLPPAVSASASGAFAVAYQRKGNVYVQAYDNSGSALGGLTRVNQTSYISGGTGSGTDPIPPAQSIGMADDGSFVVGYNNTNTTDPPGPVLRRFGPDALPLGDEHSMLISGFVSTVPAILVDHCGGTHVVAWTEDTKNDTNVKHLLLQ